jgi:hypothetical protein
VTLVKRQLVSFSTLRRCQHYTFINLNAGDSNANWMLKGRYPAEDSSV